MRLKTEQPIIQVPARMSLGSGLGDVAASGVLASHREHQGGAALPWHEHGAPYLCIVLAGGYAQTADCEIDCRRGSLVAHPAGHVHADRFGSAATRCVNMYFDPEWFDEQSLAALFDDYRHVQLDPRHAALQRLERELSTRDAGSALGIASAFLDLASHAARPSRDVTPAWLAMVRDAVAGNVSQPPDLATLAALAGVHKAHLCRVFKSATGETIGEYSRRFRLEVANAMLADNLGLAEIATATGFYDQAHFARVFRRQYGIPPAARRAQIAS